MPDARPTDGINLRPAIEGKLKERPAGIGLQSAGTAAYITHQYKLVLPGVKKKANKSGMADKAMANLAIKFAKKGE